MKKYRYDKHSCLTEAASTDRNKLSYQDSFSKGDFTMNIHHFPNIYFLTLILILSWVSQLHSSQWIPTQPGNSPTVPTIKIIEETSTYLTVKWDINGIFIDDVNTPAGHFQRVHFGNPGACGAQAVGVPTLPYLTEMIRLPHGTKATVSVIETDWISIGQARIIPQQLPQRDRDDTPEFQYNIDAYKEAGPVPEKIASVGKAQGWSGVQITGLSICPVRYYPASKKLELARSIVVKVEFRPGGNKNIIRQNHFNSRIQKNHNAAMLNSSAEQNGDDIPRPFDFDENEPVRMLVIVKEEALETAQPLIDFHYNSGLRTEVWLADDIEDEFEIKDRVSEMYEEGDGALEYLFLIGDAYRVNPDIPMHHWMPDPPDRNWRRQDHGEIDSHSDNWYVCLDGPDEDGFEDHIPDLAVGRLVYNEIEELDVQIEKIMDYYLGNFDDRDGGAWLDRVLLVAHRSTARDDSFYYVGTKRAVMNFEYNFEAPEFIAAFGSEGAENGFVIEQINETGIGIVNYRGHGRHTTWDQWDRLGRSFGSNQIDAIDNDTRPFILVSSACNNGDIATYRDDCFLEQFQKRSGGSLCAHGCVISTWREGNSHFDTTLFQAWFDEGIYDLGFAANYAMTDMVIYWDNAREGWTFCGRMNLRAYIWLGDPALEVKLGSPSELEVDIFEFLPLQVENIEAEIEMDGEPLEGVRFCIRNEEADIYLVGYSDENGHINIPFDDPIGEAMQLDWMVYHRNGIPVEGEIRVIEGIGIIQGNVTEFANGEPIGDATLELNPFGLEAVTGVNGRYRFEDVPAGQYELTARTEGFITQSTDIMVINNQVIDVDFAMRFSHLDIDSAEIYQHLEIEQEPVERILSLFNSGNGNLIWSAELEFDDNAEEYEWVWEFNPAAQTQDSCLNGIALIDGHIYIAGGNNNEDPNYFYIFNLEGNLLNSIEQPERCAGIGIRDLAYRDGYLYGSSDRAILQLVLEGDPVDSIRIVSEIDGPFDANIALAADDQGCLWIGNGTEPLFQINEQGDALEVILTDLNLRALAWYSEATDGYNLLAFVQDGGDEPVRLYEINPEDNEFRYAANLSDNANETTGNGLTVANFIQPGEWSLGGMVRRGDERRLRTWTLGYKTSWLTIEPLGGVVEPDRAGELLLTFSADDFLRDLLFTADLIINNNGNEPRIEVPITLMIGIVSAPPDDRPELPAEFIQVYPNPFNATVNIQYHLPRQSRVLITVVDIHGREVCRLVEEHQDATVHEVIWNAANASTGIYFCRIYADGVNSVVKLALIR